MAVKPAGTPLAHTEVQAEFGGVAPISLGEYYRGGPLVPNGPAVNAAIATTGAINMGSFYGAVRSRVFTQVLTGNTTNYNLRTAALASGWDGIVPLQATVTINSGVYVSATSTGVYAFNTDTLPAGSTLVLYKHGHIIGCGGAAGASSGVTNTPSHIAGSAGSPGGPALRVTIPTLIYDYGTTAGGGGGGGGGATRYVPPGGKTLTGVTRSGGAGGGRSNPAVNSAGSAPGFAGDAYLPASTVYAASGAVGAVSGGGSGGVGDGFNAGNDGSQGGAGGNWGSWGGSGTFGPGFAGYTNAGGPYAGGPPGIAITGYAFITWAASGSILGPVV